MSHPLPYARAASLSLSMLALLFGLKYTAASIIDEQPVWFLALSVAALIVAIRSLEHGIDCWLLLAPATAIAEMMLSWPWSANHIFFALWIMIPVLLRPTLLTGNSFSRYVSISMGIMMVAAGVQKLIAGHYLDGTMFAAFAAEGSLTEQWLNGICGGIITADNARPCSAMVWLGRFTVIWQLLIGICFLLCVRHPVILITEIAFMLAAGTIADEWVFQTINLLCLVFVARRALPVGLFLALVPLALIGWFHLDSFVDLFAGYFG
ncbi:MAG: hypothetical protein OXE84_08445 [Rhodobacteraceae bacterium]|nr:hypothetical protein [Paracoccaceae bacterium]MCY4196360.1 hypothetical protein [Paracoccaceae bacterium]